jgi:UDP-N-acetyl-D-mannosaminuronic acid dehydrogenase
VVRRVERLASQLDGPVIACLGLAYKNDVDDLRESPSVEIVRSLADSGVGRILAVEPHITRLPAELAEKGVELVERDAALARARVVVALVRHRQFLDVPWEMITAKMVVDACGLLR